jgi:hypothetical protein
MLSQVRNFEEQSMPVAILDAYIISNIIAHFNGARHQYVFSNTHYLHRTPNGLEYLLLFVNDRCIQGTVINWKRDEFPYSIKQLLTYLYDKIRSN